MQLKVKSSLAAVNETIQERQSQIIEIVEEHAASSVQDSDKVMIQIDTCLSEALSLLNSSEGDVDSEADAIDLTRSELEE